MAAPSTRGPLSYPDAPCHASLMRPHPYLPIPAHTRARAHSRVNLHFLHFAFLQSHRAWARARIVL